MPNDNSSRSVQLRKIAGHVWGWARTDFNVPLPRVSASDRSCLRRSSLVRPTTNDHLRKLNPIHSPVWCRPFSVISVLPCMRIDCVLGSRGISRPHRCSRGVICWSHPSCTHVLWLGSQTTSLGWAASRYRYPPFRLRHCLLSTCSR